jgi:hypothetical protein
MEAHVHREDDDLRGAQGVDFIRDYGKGKRDCAGEFKKMSEMDFDYVFPGEPMARRFTTENRRPPPHEVKWQQTKAKLENVTGTTFYYLLMSDSCVIEPKQRPNTC